MSASEDRADVLKVRGGDISAFAGIVGRWQGPLVNLAYRFCRDRGRAEDMAQEAFLRIFRGLDRFREESTFSTWLFALATNLYVSELRRLPVKTVSIEDVAEPRDERSGSERLELEDRNRAVRRAVLTLPAKYREALILFYFHGLDVSAAARSLGLPEGTVKARLHRGRELLRGKLPPTPALPRLGEVT